MRNYVVNGAFDVHNVDKNDVVVRDGIANSEAVYVAPRWLLGPGLGGVVEWSIRDFDGAPVIPGCPRHFLRLSWLKAPLAGENPPLTRWTFLENHGLRDARQLHGCWVTVTWWMRIANGTVPIVPIAWQNFQDGDFVIHGGETYPVRSERGWHPVIQSIYLPACPEGKAYNNTSYCGFGLDMIYLAGPCLDIACVSVNRTSVDLNDPRVERVLTLGQFWN